MPKDQVDRAIERIAVGRHTGEDVQLLRRQMEVMPVPGSFRIGPERLAVDHGGHVQVGDQHFYGLDAVRIRAAIDDIVRPRPDDARARDPRWGRRARGTGLVVLAAGLALMALAIGAAGGLDDEAFAGERALIGPGLAFIAAGAMLMRIARVLCDPGEQ
jgi:hypothetical protein